MRLVQVVTDYIKRSVLTTKGDLVVRGAAIPERLAAGALGNILTSQGAGEIPQYEAFPFGNFNFAQNSFNQAATQVRTIAGLGFTPSMVYLTAKDLTAGNMNWSIGLATETWEQCIEQIDMGTALNSSLTYCIRIRRNAGNIIVGYFQDFIAGGFRISFTLFGACAARIQWLAIG